MQPLNSMRHLADPAQSRLGYRLQRIWLTPMFKALIRTGIPCALVLMMVIGYIQQPTVRVAMAQSVLDARSWVYERPEFMVKLMAVEGVSPEVAEVIRNAIHIDFPLSSFDLNLDALHDQIDALPPVKDVSLRVRPGGVLEILAVERTPALVWRSEAGLALLDAEGVQVARLTHRTARADLPLVTGEGAPDAVPEALSLFAVSQEMTRDLRGLHRQGARRWDVVLDGGTTILLPETGAVSALERVILLNGAQDILARDLSHIDLRNPQRPTLRLAQNSLAELQRIKGIEFGVNE